MMPTPRTHRFRLILAAVDLSRQSAKTLRYAAAIARTCGGRVRVVHALDPRLTAAAARAYAERGLIEDTDAGLRRFVRATLGVEAAQDVDVSIVLGTARRVLASEGRRRHADVVVMATQGRSGLARTFFGSTTEALLRRYHGAIMVIPPGCPNPPPGWPSGAIVAAIDAGRHRRAMMSAAARTADVFGGWIGVTPLDRAPRAVRTARAQLTVLPLPDAARFRTFRQGTAAYRFVCRARGPVIVVRTGRAIGRVRLAARAA